jgi:hypothetical protein
MYFFKLVLKLFIVDFDLSSFGSELSGVIYNFIRLFSSVFFVIWRKRAVHWVMVYAKLTNQSARYIVAMLSLVDPSAYNINEGLNKLYATLVSKCTTF